MTLNYDRIDPELRPALERFPELQITRKTIQDIRLSLASLAPSPVSVQVNESQLTIKGEDGPISLICYRKTDRPNQPVVLWMHGGGYLMGTANDNRARVIADYCDCTVFSVDYRLAPEDPFPAGLNDCHSSLTWLMKNAEELGIDAHRLVIGGVSAGGGLAAGLALRNRDGARHPVVLQFLLYPMLDNLHDSESGRIENHPVWNRTTSFNAWEMYLDGEPGLNASPYAAAIRASSLAGLPPAYICVGTEDLFRDENIEYARRLSRDGVPCELAVLPGMYHGGDAFAPTARVSQRMQQGFLRALKDALHQT